MTKYAVLYNTDQEDRVDRPVCLLFEGQPDDLRARYLGAKKLLEELDGGSNLTTAALLRWTDNPRVVRLENLGPIVDDQPARDARNEIARELRAKQEEYRVKKEKEDEEDERRTYERLKKKFES